MKHDQHNIRIRKFVNWLSLLKAQEFCAYLSKALIVAGVYERINEGSGDGQPVTGKEQPAEVPLGHNHFVVESVQCDDLHGCPGHDEGEDHEKGHGYHALPGHEHLFVALLDRFTGRFCALQDQADASIAVGEYDHWQ